MNSKNIEDIYPLAPMQEGMLFHSLYKQEEGMYVMQDACEISNLNLAAFKDAWRKVVARHSILRTAFAWKNLDKPLQVVGREVGLPIEEGDWSALSEEEQDSRFAAYTEADRIRGYNLSKAPLMRLAFFRVSDRSYKFMWSRHHLLLDGWSRYLILNEVLTYYEAYSEGKQVELERPRPFKDYIAWLQQQDRAKSEQFWRNTLRGFSTPISIGAGHSPFEAVEASLDYQHSRLKLPAETASSLQSFARNNQLTMNTLVQGAWALLLSRYSGEPDVIFGTTVSGRPADLPGIETMVGVFINTLPVRIEARDDLRLLGWLKRIQDLQLEMRQFEHIPLAEVQQFSEIKRGANLFETLLVFENFPVDKAIGEKGAELQVSKSRVALKNNYPLVLVADPVGGLAFQILFDVRHFSLSAAHQILNHVGQVLNQFLISPDLLVGDVALDQREESSAYYERPVAVEDQLEQFSF